MNFAPASENYDKNIFQYVDYLILNEVEAEQLSGVETKTLERAKESCLNILEKFDICAGVLVTLGANGVLFADKKTKQMYHQQGQTVKVIDTSVRIFFSMLLYED